MKSTADLIFLVVAIAASSAHAVETRIAEVPTHINLSIEAPALLRTAAGQFSGDLRLPPAAEASVPMAFLELSPANAAASDQASAAATTGVVGMAKQEESSDARSRAVMASAHATAALLSDDRSMETFAGSEGPRRSSGLSAATAEKKATLAGSGNVLMGAVSAGLTAGAFLGAAHVWLGMSLHDVFFGGFGGIIGIGLSGLVGAAVLMGTRARPNASIAKAAAALVNGIAVAALLAGTYAGIEYVSLDAIKDFFADVLLAFLVLIA